MVVIALLLAMIGSRGNGSRGWHLRAATMTDEVNVMKKVREEGEAANAPEPGRTATRRRMVRELVGLALEMSDAIDAPTTSLDDRADYARRLDRMYAAAGGISMVHLARMRLLETIGRSIAVEPVVAKSHKIRHALARRELGEALSPEESELLSSGDPEVVRETKELEGLMDTSDPKHHETWRFIFFLKPLRRCPDGFGTVPAPTEPALRVLRSHRAEREAHCAVDCRRRSRRLRPDRLLDLGAATLDGRHVRRIGWQVHQTRVQTPVCTGVGA